jgi:hypothetical protein
MDARSGNEKSFDERLKEALRRCEESDEAYEAWLRERGLDRDAVARAAAGDGIGGGRDAKEAFERAKAEVDAARADAPREERSTGEAEKVLGLPAWAVKV